MFTKFENKMMEDGFIDKFGKIQKGSLAGWSFVQKDTLGRNGELIFDVAPDAYNLDQGFQIILTQQEAQILMMTKNLIQVKVIEAAVDAICADTVDTVAAETASLVQEYMLHSGMPSNATAKARMDAVNGYIKMLNETPHPAPTASFPDISDAFYGLMESMPADFWCDPLAMGTFNSKFFSKLNEVSDRFDTPEGLAICKAYGVAVGERCTELISMRIDRVRLEQKTEEGKNAAQNYLDKTNKSLLDNVTAFESKMEKSERSLAGLPPIGGEGK